MPLNAADFTNWRRKSEVTFSGYTGTETLTNFPALVVLGTNTIDGFKYEELGLGGIDLRFSDSTGAVELPYEIDTWDPDGDSYVWVRVPELEGTGTSIWAYWNQPSATAPEYTTNGAVWENGYAGVWHLQTPNAPDSTQYSNDGTAYNNVDFPGRVGTAQSFDGSSALIDCGTGSSLNLPTGLTIEAWVKPDVFNGHRSMSGKPGALFFKFTNNTLCFTTPTVKDHFSSTVGFAAGEWAHVAVSFLPGTSSGCRFYRNGFNFSSVDSSKLNGNNNPFCIGNNGSKEYFDGAIDELRVSSVIRSPDWVAATYKTVGENAIFQTYGEAETTAPIMTGAATNITASSAWLCGNLVSTGASATAAIAYWGTADCGTDAANWEHYATLPAPQNPGGFSVLISGLSPDLTYYYRVAASNESGVAWSPSSGYFITGDLVLTKTRDADEAMLSPGSFTVTRPSGAIAEELVVEYTQTGGSAVSGVDYDPLPGSVVIPAGESSVDIVAVPLKNHTVNEDTTLTLTLTNTPAILGSSVTATMTITNEPITITVVTTNITRTLFGTNNAVIYADMVDAGSSAIPTEIAELRISSPVDLTPELTDRVTLLNPGTHSNDFAVTLEVVDTFGNSAYGNATVTILLVESGYGAYKWNGAGVAGGTMNTSWQCGDNWLVGGIVPASPPGLADDASIILNQSYTNSVNPNSRVAIEVEAGATAQHVTFSGMNETERHVEFQGDATFATLDYNTAKNSFSMVEEATLTLTGGEFNPDTGAVITRTLVSPGTFSVYTIMSFAGKIRCTGEQVVLRLNSVMGDIYVDNPDATIHFDNTTVRFGGDLYVYDTQRVTGLNATWGMIANRYSRDLYSQNGNALTNWVACHIGSPDYTMNEGSPFTIPGGKYASVFVGYRGHYAGDFWYDISGDVEFKGANLRGYAVELQRLRLPSGVPAAGGARFGLNGHNLTVRGGGADTSLRIHCRRNPQH